MKDIIWLIKNGYKDVTNDMKSKGIYPPVETMWAEWSSNGTKFITTNNKIFSK